MLFNSIHFLFFLPVVVVLYYLIAFRFRWLLVFVASCYFYMAFVPEYILILFFIILIDYFSGIAIERAAGGKRKFWLVVSLVSNVLLLGFFKYFNFFNQNLSDVAGLFGHTFHPVNLGIILPIGLSFHTFQSMSYTIEVYRGRHPAERHLGYFANYVLFFPQMVAGPIERYDRLGNELQQDHKPRYENFSYGFRLILFGLLVKMAVADNLAPYVNNVYADPAAFGGRDLLLAILFFSFQIYADFYGYSTIAVGAARLLGIKIMDNFKTPYLSAGITELWSRWHISLSSWFRDYLYIPLGGNRVVMPRWVFNILVVFMVSGLWHGASWTFVAWGGLHGVFIILEKFASRITGITVPLTWNIVRILMVIKTFVITSLIWVFFRAENFDKALLIFRSLFTAHENVIALHAVTVPVFFIVLLTISDILFYNSRFDIRMSVLKPAVRWTFYTILVFFLFSMSGTHKYNFIYFQF
jgi:alginate O-acetyltransferase complex protein AlgI